MLVYLVLYFPNAFICIGDFIIIYFFLILAYFQNLIFWLKYGIIKSRYANIIIENNYREILFCKKIKYNSSVFVV